LYSPAQVEIAVKVYLNSGQLDRARKMIACADNSIRPDLHCSLGAVFAAKKEYEKALHEYKAALAIQPAHNRAIADSKAIYTSQAVSYLQCKDLRSALHCINEALALNSTDPDLASLAATIEVASALEGSDDQDPHQMLNAVEQAFQANPTNFPLAHKLALLYHQQAINLEENADSPEQLHAAWDKAIAYWALIIEADSYWDQWFLARETYYGQTIAPEVREELRRSKVKERIRQVHRNFVSEYVKTEKSDDVERHQGLMAQWSLEFNTASAVRQMLEWLQRLGSLPPLPAACGPKGWEFFNAAGTVEQAAQQILNTDRKNEAALQIVESLTPIGMVRMLRKDGQLKEAVDLLEGYVAANSRKKLSGQFADTYKDATELLVEMLIELGKTLVESNLTQAIAYWHRAIQMGAEVDQVNEIIAQSVFDQANRLADQEENKKALDLLEKGIHALDKSLKIQTTSRRKELGEIPGKSLIGDVYAKIAIAEAVDMVKKAQKGQNLPKTIRALKEAKELLIRANYLIGPNHPAVDKNLEALDQVLADASTGSAVKMVNEAIEGYSKHKLSFKDTLANLDEALRLLGEAGKVLPNDPDIKKNISDVRAVRSQIVTAEAGKLNQQGVEALSFAMNEIKKGNKRAGLKMIDDAYQLLKDANNLAPNNTTISGNLDQATIIRNALR
jgi:tetratricopeptide (TPR) repeat protein